MSHSSHVTFLTTKTCSLFLYLFYRIKTNGSLPRERRLQSPPSRHLLNSSEDELSGIFTFDQPQIQEQDAQSVAVSPPVVVLAPMESTLANSKSPYENVAAVLTTSSTPGSPRTRIRTTLPVVENGTTSSSSSSSSSAYQLITSGVAAEVHWTLNSIAKL